MLETVQLYFGVCYVWPARKASQRNTILRSPFYTLSKRGCTPWKRFKGIILYNGASGERKDVTFYCVSVLSVTKLKITKSPVVQTTLFSRQIIWLMKFGEVRWALSQSGSSWYFRHTVRKSQIVFKNSISRKIQNCNIDIEFFNTKKEMIFERF